MVISGIPAFLAKYIPQKILPMINNRNFLQNFLYQTAQTFVDDLKKIREYTEKYGPQKNIGIQALDTILLRAGFDTSNRLIDTAGAIANVIEANEKISQQNLGFDVAYNTRLLYQIANLRLFKFANPLFKIKKEIDNITGQDVLSRYDVRLENYDDSDNFVGTDYLNSLYFLYYAEGQESLKIYLKNQGFSSKIANDVSKKVKSRAPKFQQKYRKYLNPINQLERAKRNLEKAARKVENVYDQFEIQRNWD